MLLWSWVNKMKMKWRRIVFYDVELYAVACTVHVQLATVVHSSTDTVQVYQAIAYEMQGIVAQCACAVWQELHDRSCDMTSSGFLYMARANVKQLVFVIVFIVLARLVQPSTFPDPAYSDTCCLLRRRPKEAVTLLYMWYTLPLKHKSPDGTNFTVQDSLIKDFYSLPLHVYTEVCYCRTQEECMSPICQNVTDMKLCHDPEHRVCPPPTAVANGIAFSTTRSKITYSIGINWHLSDNEYLILIPGQDEELKAFPITEVPPADPYKATIPYWLSALSCSFEDDCERFPYPDEEGRPGIAVIVIVHYGLTCSLFLIGPFLVFWLSRLFWKLSEDRLPPRVPRDLLRIWITNYNQEWDLLLSKRFPGWIGLKNIADQHGLTILFSCLCSCPGSVLRRQCDIAAWSRLLNVEGMLHTGTYFLLYVCNVMN